MAKIRLKLLRRLDPRRGCHHLISGRAFLCCRCTLPASAPLLPLREHTKGSQVRAFSFSELRTLEWSEAEPYKSGEPQSRSFLLLPRLRS